MKPYSQMTRDEFLYEQIRSDRSMYKVLTFVYGACTVAAIILGVLGSFKQGPGVLLKGLALAAGPFMATYGSWCMYKDLVNALEEIGDDPTGVDTNRNYSRSTANIISMERHTKREYRQMWIAYGILALTLFGFGAFLALLGSPEYGWDSMLFILGAVLVVGGFILSFLTVKAFRSWLTARRLERLSE